MHPLLYTVLYFTADRLTDVPSLFWIIVRRCDFSSLKVRGVAGCCELGWWWCVLFGGAVRGLLWTYCRYMSPDNRNSMPASIRIAIRLDTVIVMSVPAESRGPARRIFSEQAVDVSANWIVWFQPSAERWDLRSFGILRSVEWHFHTDNSWQITGSIFKG
jgi:hypothetical protein